MKTIGFIGLELIGDSLPEPYENFTRIIACLPLTKTEVLWQRQLI